MRKHLLCAVLLAAGAACAQAEETTWHFTYQGFIDSATGLFDPDRQLTGTFRGSDGDGDGIIGAAELSYLSTGGYTYVAPFGEGCVDSTSPYLRCHVDAFSYALTGQLDFSAGYYGYDEHTSGWSGDIVTGSHFGHSRYGPLPDHNWSVRHDWTDQTTFRITPPPIPEPSAWLMLAAGLPVAGRAWHRAQWGKLPCNKM